MNYIKLRDLDNESNHSSNSQDSDDLYITITDSTDADIIDKHDKFITDLFNKLNIKDANTYDLHKLIDIVTTAIDESKDKKVRYYDADYIITQLARRVTVRIIVLNNQHR